MRLLPLLLAFTTVLTAGSDYLGEKPPGDEAVMFASGTVSTGMYELNAAWSPDGNELLFSVVNPSWSWFAMQYMKRNEQGWSKPETPPFSGKYSDADPAWSADGKRVYFISKRPRDGSQQETKDFDIWYVEKQGSGWSKAVNVGAPVNTEKDEFYVSLTRRGDLYFSANREGGMGSYDIYRAVYEDGAYTRVENLGSTVNTKGAESDPFVDPDERYLIFPSRREGGLGSYDLYITYNRAGKWTEPESLGPKINSTELDFCPYVSPDGKYLFFTSLRREEPMWSTERRTRAQIQEMFTGTQNKMGDVYWVSTSFLKLDP